MADSLEFNPTFGYFRMYESDAPASWMAFAANRAAGCQLINYKQRIILMV
jgi:hypothetical protein